jgi:hypothetical protein
MKTTQAKIKGLTFTGHVCEAFAVASDAVKVSAGSFEVIGQTIRTLEVEITDASGTRYFDVFENGDHYAFITAA